MKLSVLESRLTHKLPEEYHETIAEEFSRFRCETERMSDDKDKIGQASVSDAEIARAATTNQHGEYGHTVIELQAIKAAALEYGIEDWLSYVDPTLTHEENIDIMREQGEPTMKENSAREKAKQQWT